MAQAVPSKDRSFGSVVTATPETPISQVAASLRNHDVGCVVVAEDEARPVGILTDRQLALELTDEFDPDRVLARELMTPDPVTVERGTDVFQMLQTMAANEVRRLPVVDEDGALDGLVAFDDIIQLLGTEMGTAAALIDAQT